ncbi:MAG: sporulation transcription factor Spo0A [Clostridia bacterium]|nr:sporulation transcription factor Spo0A [Clostridia bacterium]
MKNRILLVDDSEELLSELETFLTSRGFDIVGKAADGERAVELAELLKPDIMILDLVMPKMDGFSVLEKVDRSNMRILVLSALSQDAFIAKAAGLGADYYMIKPCSHENLAARLKDLSGSERPAVQPSGSRPVRAPVNKSLDEKITNIFITVGIPAHIKGYQFLREAIKMAIDNPDIINSITKRLYPEVAERFSTSPSKVERAIRHAIEVAWNRGKIENINSLFGVRVYNHNEKPTNGEFIALVADKMLLESV